MDARGVVLGRGDKVYAGGGRQLLQHRGDEDLQGSTQSYSNLAKRGPAAQNWKQFILAIQFRRGTLSAAFISWRGGHDQKLVLEKDKQLLEESLGIGVVVQNTNEVSLAREVLPILSAQPDILQQDTALVLLSEGWAILGLCSSLPFEFAAIVPGTASNSFLYLKAFAQ
ncbi:hypothetical protein P7K49_031611 [Saguinus oedipus]|uniref:Uncharacterized protein n=1 Tax=Saguinus oedipus TaxID=9490 RepID=A0ABQ9U0U0_SAGOE|nr:hypothetical protein P7K49_031611 [Saguinus oedipus]